MFAKLHPAIPQEAQTTKEENNMTEFHTERQHLDRDLRKSYGEHLEKLRDHYHVNPTQPKTLREALQMLADKKFDRADDDKYLDRKWSKYDGNPLYDVTLREKPADMEGFHAAEKKLDETHRAHSLKVQVHEPTEALKHVESFRTATFH